MAKLVWKYIAVYKSSLDFFYRLGD